MNSILADALSGFTLTDLPLWIMQGVYVASAVLVLAHGFAIWREERAAPGWPAIQGRVTDVHRSTGPTGQRLPHPLGDVTYEYSVAGHRYASHRVAFDALTWQQYRRMLEYVGMLSPGSRVTVYYNPARPAQAVLDRRTSVWDALLFIACGLAMLALRPMVFSFHPDF